MAEFDLVEIFRALESREVEYVVIGAIAARIAGAPIVTADLDITPAMTRDNLERLSTALNDLGARLRTPDDAAGIPFPIKARMLETADVWTLATRYGDLDLVFMPTGTRGYEDLRRDASRNAVGHDLTVLSASLRDVIRTKEATGRTKDQAQLPLLRETLDAIRERERSSTD